MSENGHVDTFLADLRAKLATGLTHAEVMQQIDSGEFARAALDEVQQRGTSEILEFGAEAGKQERAPKPRR